MLQEFFTLNYLSALTTGRNDDSRFTPCFLIKNSGPSHLCAAPSPQPPSRSHSPSATYDRHGMFTALSLQLTKTYRFAAIHPAPLARPFSKGLHADGYSHLLNILVSKFPLGEGGRPKAGGWIRLAEADSAKQVNTPMAEPRYCRFAASILRLWRGPSLRACMLMDILTY